MQFNQKTSKQRFPNSYSRTGYNANKGGAHVNLRYATRCVDAPETEHKFDCCPCRFDNVENRLPPLTSDPRKRMAGGAQALRSITPTTGVHVTSLYRAQQTKQVLALQSFQRPRQPQTFGRSSHTPQDMSFVRATTGFDPNFTLLGSRSSAPFDGGVHLPRPMTQAGDSHTYEREKQALRPKTQQSYSTPHGDIGMKSGVRISVPKLSKKEIVFEKDSPPSQFHFHMLDLSGVNGGDTSSNTLMANNSTSSFDFPKRSFKTQKIKGMRRTKTPLPSENTHMKMYNLRSDIQSSDVLFVSSQRQTARIGRSTLYQFPMITNTQVRHIADVQDQLDEATKGADAVPDPEAITLLENAVARAEEHSVNADRAKKKLHWFRQRLKVRQDIICGAVAGNDALVDNLIEKAALYQISDKDESVRQARLILSKTASWTGREGTDVVVGGKRVLNGKYEVIQIVGEGAYGMVMRCRQKGTNKFVAIKEFKISAEDPDAEEVRKSSIREVKLLKFLQHENIVKYLDDFSVGDKIFMVMEFVPRNLLEVLEENEGGLPKPMMQKVIYQLCKAVSFIHNHGFIYRDIKPENLLIDDYGNVKLCDFGFGRYIEKISESDDLTDYVATRWYRAPELLLGPPFETDDGSLVRSPYGPAIDIWAIGCLMAELIDGEPLFAGDSDIDQLEKIQKSLGRITSKQMKMFLINPANAGYCFPFDNEPLETIKQRYGGQINAAEEDFLLGMLNMDPMKRPSGEECLQHSYFADL